MNTRADTPPVFALNGGRFHTVRNPVAFPKAAPPAKAQDRVLTLAEAAAVVPLSAKTLYRVAQRGEGPFRKVEGRWLVYETELHDWVRSHRGQPAARRPAKRSRSRRRGGSMRSRVLEAAAQ